ncbi:Head decoration protein [Shigella boydii ATCC 9905]|nr:Head decoration protein [Shigella boydii ATCC 9905]RIF68994.1 head decoration protein [Shigella boydii]
MTSKETFTHYQPLGNSDPAHTATAPGGLSAKAPAMTPLMPDTSTRSTSPARSVMRMCSGRRLPAMRRKNGPRLPERQSASFNLTLHH